MGNCAACHSTKEHDAQDTEEATRCVEPAKTNSQSALDMDTTLSLDEPNTPTATALGGRRKPKVDPFSKSKKLQVSELAMHEGFIAALDQTVSMNGDSENLKLYGVNQDDQLSEEELQEKVTEFRVRMMTDTNFNADRITGCVITQKSLESMVCGMTCAKYLWKTKQITPIVRVDLDLESERNGVRLMKVNTMMFDVVLDKALRNSVIGVKVRSLITKPNAVGIKNVIDQQFQLCQKMVDKHLIPILQPEIDIKSLEKEKCEHVLIDVLIDALDGLATNIKVVLVLTIPTTPNLYLPLIRHSNVLRVAALSGGYDRTTACKKLEQNVGMIALFARALTEDLHIGLPQEDFSCNLNSACDALFQASLSVEEEVERMARLTDQAGFMVALTPRALLPMLSSEDHHGPDIKHKMHECLRRIFTNPSFNSARIIAVLMTLEFCKLEILPGTVAAEYVWNAKGVIPFAILTTELEAEKNGVQLMQLPHNWENLLEEAKSLNVCGVQLRGMIKRPHKAGINALVNQQFEVGKKMMEKGLLPKMLLEVDISCDAKAQCEEILLDTISSYLGNLKPDQRVTLELACPCKPNLYLPLLEHPNTLRVGAPSAGYSCADACRLLSDNVGMIGIFGRAFTERLKYTQSEEEFSTHVGETCKAIHQATVAVSAKEEQMMKINHQDGFFIILDNTGSATAKAMKRYGIDTDKYSSEKDIDSKFHQMITRIVTNDKFAGDRVIGTCLSKQTMELNICGLPSAKYLWSQKGTVPFLKIDNGLMAETNGVQLMHFKDDIPELTNLLDRAAAAGVFGTKQRSFIKLPNPIGIKAVIEQQLEMGRHVCAKGLLPILQPEVDINSPKKAMCEDMLLDILLDGLEKLRANEKVVLLLTLPTKRNLYLPLMGHPNVIRLVALSGGYSQKESCKMLKANVNMIAGFGRAFVEGMTVKQKDATFAKVLDQSCSAVFNASKSLPARDEQLVKLTTQSGFFVGFDQDASSMPKMLSSYGVTDQDYTDEATMMEKAHELHSRIVQNTQFNGSRCIGVILTKNALALNFGRLPCAKFLWEIMRIVPFMKLDRGLASEEDGVRLMKDIPDLNKMLDKAIPAGIFGTITRSVIKLPSTPGVRAIIHQQIEIAKQVMRKGLVPIMQIEVDINSPDKSKCERLLTNSMMRGLDDLGPEQRVILDLTLPNVSGTYNQLVKHAKVLRVAALSGGYSRADACKMLEQNKGMIASFGRAFTEGLHITQTDNEFTSQIMGSCKLLYNAAHNNSKASGEEAEETSMGA